MGNWPACLHYTGVQCCCSSHKFLYLLFQNPWVFYEEGTGPGFLWMLSQCYCHLCLMHQRHWLSLTNRTHQVEENSCGSSGISVGSLETGAGKGQAGKTSSLHTGQTLKLSMSSGTWASVHLHGCLHRWMDTQTPRWRKRYGDRALH